MQATEMAFKTTGRQKRGNNSRKNSTGAIIDLAWGFSTLGMLKVEVSKQNQQQRMSHLNGSGSLGRSLWQKPESTNGPRLS